MRFLRSFCIYGLSGEMVAYPGRQGKAELPDHELSARVRVLEGVLYSTFRKHLNRVFL